MQPLIDFLRQLFRHTVFTGEIIIDIHKNKIMKVSKREQVKL